MRATATAQAVSFESDRGHLVRSGVEHHPAGTAGEQRTLDVRAQPTLESARQPTAGRPARRWPPTWLDRARGHHLRGHRCEL
jgi:hypothetical protein